MGLSNGFVAIVQGWYVMLWLRAQRALQLIDHSIIQSTITITITITIHCSRMTII
jgi:hypothetical protein